jgi:hypothetical protein
MKRIILAVILLLPLVLVHGLNPNGFERTMHLGHVYARAVVKDESSGLPLWAEYNEQGGLTKLQVDLAQAADGKVVSGSSYLAYMASLQSFNEQYQSKVDVYSTEEFLNIASSLTTKDGIAINGWPTSFSSDILSIAIPAKEKRLQGNATYIERLVFPVNLKAEPAISANIKSVLLDATGNILVDSTERIGLLSAFYVKKGEEIENSTDYDNANSLMELYSYDILDPVAGVFIEGFTGYINGADVSDSDGRYKLNMRVSPCPGFAYFPTTYATARLYYANFDPRGEPVIPYYLDHHSYDSCNGLYMLLSSIPSMGAQMAALAVMGIVLAAPENITTVNYAVAINILAGQVVFPRVDIVEDVTSYSAEQSPSTEYMASNDYDADGIIDTVVRGAFNSEGVFEASATSSTYGVKLSGSLKPDQQPNFTRVMDILPELKHKGLLAKIATGDLINTDLYIFRESTGELITERKGVPQDEVRRRGVNRLLLDVDNQFSYTMPFRSPESSSSSQSSAYGHWLQWQVANQMSPALQQHKSDFLRNGEQLRIVAINRATGYIGTMITTLQAATDGGNITSPVQPITMGPPNLKVWATRRVQPQGLLKTADKDRYTISNEGAAEVNDYVIEVHTQWLDANGYALPDGLKGRGYTGRLVKVSSDPGEGGDVFSTQVTEFPINPGRELQVVKFNEGEAGKYHYHLQVNGESDTGLVDFSVGDLTGVLRHRPSKYVPLLVPIFNENATNQNRSAQIEHEVEERDVEAAFNWFYRPELSFSVVDLEVSSIFRNQNSQELSDVKEDDIPILSSNDDAIKFIFDLSLSALDRITPLDGEQEYILALGEEEVAITIVDGENSARIIVFSNIEHLTEIEPEDFLTARLYLNQDSQNVLWEWAFNVFQIRPQPLQEDLDSYIYVNADDAYANPEYIYGMLFGDVTGETAYNVRWATQGSGSVTPVTETNNDGIFSTALKLPVTTDSIVKVKAALNGGEANHYSASYKITSGKPKYINSLSKTGTTSISGAGGIDVELEIKDRFFNKVADGTPVSILADDVDVQGDLITVDGKINFTLLGLNSAGSKQIVVTSGDADLDFSIDVGDVELTITPISEAKINQIITVEITATGDADGMLVNLGAHRGKLDNTQVVIQGGRATATVFTGEIPGSANIFARFGEKVTHYDYQILDENPDDVLLDRVLVKDSASGSIQVSGQEFQYTNSTQVRIKGTPGEVVPVSLQDAIEPLVRYEFTEKSSSGAIKDKQSDYDAASAEAYVQKITYPGQNYGIKLGDGGKITTAYQSALSLDKDVAFTLSGKFLTPGTLVNYEAASMSLIMEDDQSFTLSVTTTLGETNETNETSVTSVTSKTFTPEQWLNIQASFTDNELTLSINGHTVKAAVSGTLQTTTPATAVTLGGNPNQAMWLVDFAIIDLSGVQLLGLEGGGLSGDFTVQDDGYARVNVQVPAATIAYYQEKQRQQRYEIYANTTRYNLFKQVFAAEPQGGACSVSPVTPDYVLSQAEALLQTILDCVIGKRIETVTIRYETADGFKEKVVAMAEKALLETLYSHLNWGGKGLLVAADCMQGVLTGDPQSGVGATCDFISSLLLIGDVRDLIFQSFYWFVDDQENFSPMTATFATLGLASAALTATVAGAPVGVSMKLAASAAKMIPKAFRGAKFLPHLADFINKKVLVDNWEVGAKNMERAMPFIELTAFIGFSTLSGEMAPVRDFISAAIKDPEDMYVWVDYLADMAKKAAAGLLTENQYTPQQEVQRALYAVVTGLVGEAYAASIFDNLQSVTVKKFIEIIEEVKGMQAINTEVATIPKVFTQTLKALNKLDGDEKIINVVKFLPDTNRALINVFGVAGIDGLHRFTNYRGVARGSTSIPIEDFVKIIGKIESDDVAGMEKGLKEIFNNFDTKKGLLDDATSTGFKKSSGATHEIYRINDAITDQAKQLLGIQTSKTIKDAAGNIVGDRKYDLKVKEGGVTKLIDSKAWSVSTITNQIPKSLKPGARGSGHDNPGQMFRDLVSLKNLEASEVIVWSFDKRALALGKTKIFEMVKKAAIKNEKELRKSLGLKGERFDGDWDEYLDRTLKNKFKIEIEVH